MDTTPTNIGLELNKTKWIIIGVVALLIVLLLGFVFFKPVKYIFKTPLDKELSDVQRVDFQVSPQALAKALLQQDKNLVLVDVRSQFDFAKSHLPNANNIYKVNLMEDKNIEFFTNLEEGNKKVVLYGSTASDANVPFMILKQMGFENIQFLAVGYEEVQSADWTLIATNTNTNSDETAVADFAKFISDANQASALPKKVVKTVAKPKVFVMPVKSAASRDEGC